MTSPGALLQNRYEIQRQLSQGGMGTVFLASDRRLGSTVVLKQTLYNQARFLKAFLGEAQLLANLRHPHLPLVTDFFSEGDGHFLVMQFIPGKDLNELLEERRAAELGPFPIDQVMRWADQLLDALEYLHRHDPPIVHRDLKPQNLKRTPEGNIMLLDFGLAKGAAGDMSQASPSIHGYTQEYASLEQIRGVGTDPRSDLYSLAATLYHLLTGEPPVDALARLTSVINNQPDPLPKADLLNPQVPQAIAEILHQALSQNADPRPASAAAMRQALRRASPDLPWTSPPAASTVSGTPPVSTQQRDTVLTRGQNPAAPSTVVGATEKPVEMIPTPVEQTAVRNGVPRPRVVPAVGVLIAAILLAGGIYAYRSWHVNPPVTENSAKKNDPGAGNANKLAEAPRQLTEVLRYSVKRSDQPGDIKFQFTPINDGYLYILAPGKKGVTTTALTAKSSGKVSNRLSASQVFTFPDGSRVFINLESDTRFMIIFSTLPLTQPAFLASAAGHALTEAEQKELEDFRRQSQTGQVEPGAENSTSLKAPVAQGIAGPVVFEVEVKSRVK